MMLKRLVLRCMIVATMLIPAAAYAQNGCEGAPLSRLFVGGRAEVAASIDRLRLRALPAVDTGVVASLSRKTPLEVIGGPSCNGGYTWWRVELANGERGWVAEGSPDTYFVTPTWLVWSGFEEKTGCLFSAPFGFASLCWSSGLLLM